MRRVKEAITLKGGTAFEYQAGKFPLYLALRPIVNEPFRFPSLGSILENLTRGNFHERGQTSTN